MTSQRPGVRRETPALRMRNGGSAPAELLARVLEAPVLFYGTGLPEDHWHDADEKAAMDVLVKGAEVLSHLWEKLAMARAADSRHAGEDGRGTAAYGRESPRGHLDSCQDRMGDENGGDGAVEADGELRFE